MTTGGDARRTPAFCGVAAALIAAAIFLVSMCGNARANPTTATGYQFVSNEFSVHENAGQAVITVERPVVDALEEGQVRYNVQGTGLTCDGTPCSAVAATDFTAEKAMLTFPVGVTAATFSVPLVDHGQDSLPETILLTLFGPYPTAVGLGTPSSAVLTIQMDDSGVSPRVLSNPLGLTTPPGANPLAGALLYVDPQSPAALAAQQIPVLDAIASQPDVKHFGDYSKPDPGLAAEHYLANAAATEPGTIPMLATYRLVDGHCGHWSDPPADVASYEAFISRFAQGVGSYRAVLFLEMDALITTPCLSPDGVSVRMAELRYAINTLTADCPHLVIYLDSGAADALPAADMARLLVQAGVEQIQGFFLNSTHFDWTEQEVTYGETISKLTGGKHFVVNTAENGQGPYIPKDRANQGNEQICDPPNRGLGVRPTTHTGFRNVDAFAWIANPGISGGQCAPGAPPTGFFWNAGAISLVEHANYTALAPPPVTKARTDRALHSPQKKHHKKRSRSNDRSVETIYCRGQISSGVRVTASSWRLSPAPADSLAATFTPPRLLDLRPLLRACRAPASTISRYWFGRGPGGRWVGDDRKTPIRWAGCCGSLRRCRFA